MSKCNEGGKLQKFYRNRFSVKGEGRGTQSNTSAEGKNTCQSCRVMDLVGEAGCRGWRV